MYRDIYFFLEICPFGTSLLSTGRLFILMCCPTGTFIGSGLLLDPQEYVTQISEQLKQNFTNNTQNYTVNNTCIKILANQKKGQTFYLN